MLNEGTTQLITHANCRSNSTYYMKEPAFTAPRDQTICTLGFTPHSAKDKMTCTLLSPNGTCIVYGAGYYGDSGSPLQLKLGGEESGGRWTAIGLDSWGVYDGFKTVLEPGTVQPGIYTRLSAFCRWMLEVSGGEVECDYWRRKGKSSR